MTIQFNKQKNVMNATIKDLKCKIVEQNQRWGLKIDQLRVEYQKRMEQNSKEWEAKIFEIVQSKIVIIRK